MSTLTKIALGFIGQLKPDRVKARAIAPSMSLPAPLMQALRLTPHERVIVAQTVGYPLA